MKLFIVLGVATAIAAQAPNPSQPPCPTFTPGQPYPWQSREAMKGDQWAWVHLFIDKQGHAKDCRIGDTNVGSKDTRWYICNSFKNNWYTKPLMKDGKPIEGWFKRYLIITNGRHLDTDAKARTRFFAEHPEERRECYPEYR
jgi:hypothetical protein